MIFKLITPKLSFMSSEKTATGSVTKALSHHFHYLTSSSCLIYGLHVHLFSAVEQINYRFGGN